MADVRAPPTPTAMLIATAILAGLSGYMIGIYSSLGFLPIPFQASKSTDARRKSRTENYDDEEESSGEDIDEAVLDHAPNWANGAEADKRDGLKAAAVKEEEVEVKKEAGPSWENSKEDCKLVLVVRTDLGMTKGIYLPALEL